ncbi:DMT family transporter [Bacillus sp. REN3]|uniref:DMT family transporter n=1 Tax=Bacillus sp. REN3 TaxID=2802440 RepID=UPI001AEECD7C|nr:DMT family transporter [Bacillus sp. REN3]
MRNAIELEKPHEIERRKKTIPYSFVIMWSSGAIFVELGLRYADPFIFLFLRLFLSAFIFWGVVLYLKTEIPTKKNEWAYILLTGLCMQAGYQIFYFLALDNHISPGVLTIFLGAQPIITTMVSKEKSNEIQWMGLSLGIIGLILVVGDSIAINTISFVGIVSAFFSLISITIGTLLQKHIQLSQPSNMAIQYSGAAIVLFVLTIVTKQSIEWTAMFTVSLGWMVLVISVGATILLYYMIQNGNLTNVTSLLYSVPPVTAILDYFVFKNTLELMTISGMILIIIGLFLVNREGKFT